MNTMHQEGNALIYENDGELLRIEPWGKNSLRVRSVMQGPICDTDYALIELNEADKAIVPSISVSEYEASITNGKITALPQHRQKHKQKRHQAKQIKQQQ